MVFNKGGKNIQKRKDNLFSKWCWKSWTAARRSMNLEHSLTAYTKINSKWLKDLDVRHTTVKRLEDNMGKTLFGINCSNIFLSQSLKKKEKKS